MPPLTVFVLLIRQQIKVDTQFFAVPRSKPRTGGIVRQVAQIAATTVLDEDDRFPNCRPKSSSGKGSQSEAWNTNTRIG